MTLQVLDSPDPRHVALNIGNLKANGLKAAILYISPINLQGDKSGRKRQLRRRNSAIQRQLAIYGRVFGRRPRLFSWDITRLRRCDEYLSMITEPQLHGKFERAILRAGMDT